MTGGGTPVALAETRTLGQDKAPAQLVRYQHVNHLGSAVLELDDQSGIISYEEYFPYGSTSYQAVASQTDLPKRYRYTGKERDEENDLYYHGARYYAPWLGRWTACDPAGPADGPNLYGYVRGSPVARLDDTGTQSRGSEITFTDADVAAHPEAHRVVGNPPAATASEPQPVAAAATVGSGAAQPGSPPASPRPPPTLPHQDRGIPAGRSSRNSTEREPSFRQVIARREWRDSGRADTQDRPRLGHQDNHLPSHQAHPPGSRDSVPVDTQGCGPSRRDRCPPPPPLPPPETQD